jgi:type IV secretion system protein VirD4
MEETSRPFYDGVVSSIEAVINAVFTVFFWFPDSWPAWVKLGIIIIIVALCYHYSHYIAKAALWLVIGLPMSFLRRLRLLSSSPFGRAKWAKLRDLRREGLTKPGGLFLGRWKRTDLHHHGEGHFITIAAPGGGKTSAALIPSLLISEAGSFIVTDPKGEITAITRRYRQTCGQVVYLNPFFEDFEKGTGLTYPDTGFNPFDMLVDSPNLRAQADNFARLLCVTDRKESGSYFQDEGAELLSLFITWIARYEVPENRNLSYLYELVRNQPKQVFDFMDYVDDPLIGFDAMRFADMVKTAPAQWTGAISKAQLATKRYIPTTPLGNHTSKNGFNPTSLKREDVTVYILLPSEHIQTGAPWLNMVIGMLGEAVGRPGAARPVTFLLDELPALGYLPDLRTQMRQYRAAGLRMWLFSQTTAALSDPAMYGQEGLKDLFGLCDTKQFFAVREYPVAAEISRMCGEKARINQSQQVKSESFSTVGVPLIRPEEIIKLKKNEQILIRRGLPIRAKLVPYFTRIGWRTKADKNPYMVG